MSILHHVRLGLQGLWQKKNLNKRMARESIFVRLGLAVGMQEKCRLPLTSSSATHALFFAFPSSLPNRQFVWLLCTLGWLGRGEKREEGRRHYCLYVGRPIRLLLVFTWVPWNAAKCSAASQSAVRLMMLRVFQYVFLWSNEERDAPAMHRPPERPSGQSHTALHVVLDGR